MMRGRAARHTESGGGFIAHRGTVMVAILLVAATLLAYLPSLSAGFVWDDDDYVTANPNLDDAAGLARTWTEPGSLPQYYPLVHTTFWLEHQLWGDEPAGYHMVNILLHAAAALLLWRLLVALAVPGAALAGALFALHPVAVETVAWVTELKNVQAGVLGLGAALAFVRWAELDGAERTPGRRRAWYGASVLLFTGALLSKTAVAPLAVVLLLLLWWKRGRVSLGDGMAVLPMLALAVGLGLLTVVTEVHHVGAEGIDWHLSLLERVLLAGRVTWFYTAKLAWPHPLIFFYRRWPVSAAVWWQYLFPLAALAIVAGLWRLRGRLGRGPLVAVLAFGGMLFPAMGFFDVYPMRFSWVADHFQYLAAPALLALAAAGLSLAARHAGVRHTVTRGVLAVLLLAPLAGLTWNRTHAFHDLESLWTDTVAQNPDAWLAHTNLGSIYAQRGDSALAMEHYRRSLALKDDYALTHTDLGAELLKQGRLDEAEREHRRALELYPDLAAGHSNLAVVLMEKARRDLAAARPQAAAALLREAEEHLERALEILPDYTDAHYNLGSVLAARGHYGEAEAELRRALTLAPDLAAAHDKLGQVYAVQGRWPEAAEELERALVLEPDAAGVKQRLDEVRRHLPPLGR